MIKRRASEIFAEIDPHLKVISGGTNRRRHGNSHLHNHNWDRAGGLNCPQCKAETVRLISGLCPQCHQEAEAERARKLEDRTERRYYHDQLRKGTINLAQMREGRLGS